MEPNSDARGVGRMVRFHEYPFVLQQERLAGRVPAVRHVHGEVSASGVQARAEGGAEGETTTALALCLSSRRGAAENEQDGSEDHHYQSGMVSAAARRVGARGEPATDEADPEGKQLQRYSSGPSQCHIETSNRKDTSSERRESIEIRTALSV